MKSIGIGGVILALASTGALARADGGSLGVFDDVGTAVTTSDAATAANPWADPDVVAATIAKSAGRITRIAQSNPNHDNVFTDGNYQYGYGPAFLHADGQYYAYFCSSGVGPDEWDSIRIMSSADLVTWTRPLATMRVHLHAGGTERSNCDPSVVRADDGYFYMFYGDSVEHLSGTVNVARSKDPWGPWAKWSADGTWTVDSPDPVSIIGPVKPEYGAFAPPRSTEENGAPAYGAGQPSVVYRNGHFFMWWTDNSVDWTGRPDGLSDAQIEEKLTAMVLKSQGWTNRPASVTDYDWAKLRDTQLRVLWGGRYHIFMSVSEDGLTWHGRNETNVRDRNSVDVKYDGRTGKFLMFSIETKAYGGGDGQFDPDGAFGAARVSDDGLTWSEPLNICPAGTCLPSTSQNPGVVSDDTGQVSVKDLRLAYGAPWDNSGLCPFKDEKGNAVATCWDIYMSATSLPLEPTETSLMAVYRFYNPNNGDHLLTTFREEGFIAHLNPEGQAFNVFTLGTSSRRPIYRCYNSDSGDHFVSKFDNCENLVAESALGFVETAQTALAPIEIRRCYGSNHHLVTSNMNDCAGIQDDGQIGFVH